MQINPETRTANTEETRDIFIRVDEIEPLDVSRRIREGEKIARTLGLTLFVKKQRGPKVFNPWVRGIGNK